MSADSMALIAARTRKRVLRYIKACISESGIAPTAVQASLALDISLSSAQRHMRSLAESKDWTPPDGYRASASPRYLSRISKVQALVRATYPDRYGERS